ncbi:MAG: glycosyltransferase, partial [Caulobacteraceae bacterium]
MIDVGGAQAPREGALAVVPCLNERDSIAGVIAAILDDPDWPDPLVVVADGGSTDGSLELAGGIAAADPRVRLVRNPARLQSAGVNAAAERFGGGRRWMVRVDAHSLYPRGYVSALVAEAESVATAASVVVSIETKGQGAFQ